MQLCVARSVLSHLIAVALLIVNATHKTIFDKQANKNKNII